MDVHHMTAPDTNSIQMDCTSNSSLLVFVIFYYTQDEAMSWSKRVLTEGNTHRKDLAVGLKDTLQNRG